MKQSQEAVVSVIAAYCQAVFDRDVAAFMRLYDSNVRVFDAWNVWSYEGAAAWKGAADEWLSALGDERVRVTVEDLHVHGDSPLVVATAIFRYAAVSKEGVELRALQNRLSWTLRFDGEAWRIVHEHTSMPVGHADGKGIFARVGVA